MTWTSTFDAGFTKPLLRQLMAVVQRDQRAALDFVGGAGVLPSITDYLLAVTPLRQFPAVSLAPRRSSFDRAAVGSLHSLNEIVAAVAVQNQDRARLGELVQDYVHALDAILNSLELNDLYGSLPLTLPHLGAITTVPLAEGVVKDVWVQAHAYDEIRSGRGQFTMAATLSLMVEMEET